MYRTPSRTLQHAVLLVATLFPAVGRAQDAPPPPPGMIRQLVCRGDAGVHIAVDQDPSPRGPKLVVAAMTYRRTGVVPGVDYAALEPGACTWNPGGFDGIKAEPGIVRRHVECRIDQPARGRYPRRAVLHPLAWGRSEGWYNACRSQDRGSWLAYPARV